jgi:hypothetical protein
MLFNPWTTDPIRVTGQSPVDREGISHEKPGSWQSLRNVAGYGNRAAVDTQQNVIKLHVLIG